MGKESTHAGISSHPEIQFLFDKIRFPNSSVVINFVIFLSHNFLVMLICFSLGGTTLSSPHILAWSSLIYVR